MFLMIDNYDSFTYILVDYFRRLGVEMEAYRHDEITTEEIEKISPRAIVLSPGPKDPDNAGITVEAIKSFFDTDLLRLFANKDVGDWTF